MSRQNFYSLKARLLFLARHPWWRIVFRTEHRISYRKRRRIERNRRLQEPKP